MIQIRITIHDDLITESFRKVTIFSNRVIFELFWWLLNNSLMAWQHAISNSRIYFLIEYSNIWFTRCFWRSSILRAAWFWSTIHNYNRVILAVSKVVFLYQPLSGIFEISCHIWNEQPVTNLFIWSSYLEQILFIVCTHFIAQKYVSALFYFVCERQRKSFWYTIYRTIIWSKVVVAELKFF